MGWSSGELIESWTLADTDWGLVANKSGPTRLGFALLLKFYEIEGRFPREPSEVPAEAVIYVAQLVEVDPEAFERYSWVSRTIEYHRAQIREAFGTRLGVSWRKLRYGAIWVALFGVG